MAIRKNINEGFTEFADTTSPWNNPMGRIGRFFKKFFSNGKYAGAEARAQDQYHDPTNPNLKGRKPLHGDAIQSPDVIMASVGVKDRSYPILPRIEQERKKRYKEYEDMDGYPEIGSAFDIYADDCSQENLDGSKWDVITDDELIREEVSNLFDSIELDNYLWDIVRNTVKYGDNFLELVVDTEDIKQGIQRIKILNPNFIFRVEDEFGYLDKFLQEIPKKNDWTTYGAVGPQLEEGQIIELDAGQIVHFRLITSDPSHVPYGKGIASNARATYKSLKMMEDAMLIYRLCLTGDTRVQTDSGYKYIKDIRKGDQVYCFAGPNNGLVLTPVTNSWETGLKPVFEVKSKHFKLRGTDTHPVLVLDSETNEVSYVPIKDLDPKKHSFTYRKSINNNQLKALFSTRDLSCKLKNPEIFSTKKIHHKEKVLEEFADKIGVKLSSIRNFLYGSQYLNQDIAFKVLKNFDLLCTSELDSKFEGFCSNQNFNVPEYVDEEFARLFGFLLGDGSVDVNRIVFAEGVYPEQNEYYAEILRKYFGNCNRYPCKDRTYSNYYTNSTLGAELMRSLGFIVGSHNKRIPEWAFKLPDHLKIALVRGFCDADGTTRQLLKNNWSSEIEICNLQLLEDIKELWTSAGLSSGHITTRVRKSRVGPHGNIIPEGSYHRLFVSDIPLQPFEEIHSVKPSGEELVYDIEVAHEKHNFIANGVVVHNSRAPERRIFYIDTGSLPATKAEQHLQRQMDKFKKSKLFNRSTGNIEESFNALAADEDFYIAVNGTKSGTKIETLPGADNLGEVDDVKYFRDKLLAALKIPKDYIVEKDQAPDRKANLSQLDVKFARVINRIQKSIERGLETIAKRHLMIKGFPLGRIEKVKVKLPAPSDMARKRQLDLDEQKARVVGAVKQLGIFPIEKIYKEYYQLNDHQIDEIKSTLKKEQKDPVFSTMGMAGGGMGMPGAPMPGGGGIPQEAAENNGEPAENIPPTQNEDTDLNDLISLVEDTSNSQELLDVLNDIRTDRILTKTGQKVSLNKNASV